MKPLAAQGHVRRPLRTTQITNVSGLLFSCVECRHVLTISNGSFWLLQLPSGRLITLPFTTNRVAQDVIFIASLIVGKYGTCSGVFIRDYYGLHSLHSFAFIYKRITSPDGQMRGSDFALRLRTVTLTGLRGEQEYTLIMFHMYKLLTTYQTLSNLIYGHTCSCSPPRLVGLTVRSRSAKSDLRIWPSGDVNTQKLDYVLCKSDRNRQFPPSETRRGRCSLFAVFGVIISHERACPDFR